MSWFELTIVHVLLLSVCYFFNKALLSRKGVDSSVHGALMQLGVGILAIPIIIYTYQPFTWTITNSVMLISLVLVYSSAVALYYAGLQKTDLSKTVILESSVGGWSLVWGGIIANETIDISKIVGAGIILVAVGLVAGFGKWRNINKYEWMILGSAVLYALGGTLDKLMTLDIPPLTYLGISFFVTGLFMLLIQAGRWKNTILKLDKIYFRNLAVVCGLVLVTYWALFTAYTRGGEVSKMLPMQQASTVIVAIAAVWLFKEKTDMWKKFVALGLVVLAGWMMR